MQTIIAQFEQVIHAESAVRALLERKYDRADISFIANDVKSDTALGDGSGTPAGAGQASIGLLLGIGSFMIPGVGPLLAAGPLAVGVAGAASGVAQKDAHWLDPLLGGYGIPEASARAYSERLHSGGALVLIPAREEVSDNIIGVLESSGAVQVDTHARDPNSSGA